MGPLLPSLTASQIAALLAGQVDMVPNVPMPDRERLAAATGITLLTGPSDRQHLLYTRFESESGDLQKKYPGYQPATLDKRIRQAISHHRTAFLHVRMGGTRVHAMRLGQG